MSYMPPERLKTWSRPRQTLKGMVEDKPRKRLPDGTLLTKRETLAQEWFEGETKVDSWALGSKYQRESTLSLTLQSLL